MSYFCYIYSPRSEVPHMEVLKSRTLDEARRHSGRLLAEHVNAFRAELFDDDRQVAVISPDDDAAPDDAAPEYEARV
ncbi:MAG: hypothetical protein JWP35_2227 [Caulobacter sp.]|jgi:hypothetical protein|nr:hypothetical protein [Caulobacter sp.]